MKLVLYDLCFTGTDGRLLRVGGFNNIHEAENAEPGWRLRPNMTFVGIERRCVEVTAEKVLQMACVVCGEYVGDYDSSWRDKHNFQHRACREHICPDGFYYWTDG